MIAWIIAGLGNPGKKYETTRHNAGFLALETLARQQKVKLNKLKFEGLCGEWGSRLLLLPQTFMNDSGRSLRRAMDFYKLPPERVLVVFDDVALPPGKLRVRASGSDGGHNGLKSILYHLGSDMFPRVKIGVGEKPHPEMDLADWVLSSPSAQDSKLIGEAIGRAAEVCEVIVEKGLEPAMNLYN